MKGKADTREEKIAWKLTQIAILALTIFLLFSILNSWSDSNKNNVQVTESIKPNDSTALPESTTPSSKNPESVSSDSLNTEIISPKPPRTFTLIASGELLIHEFVAEKAADYAETGFNFSPMFQRVKPILAGADLALCHLETPLSSDNSELSYYPKFQVPFELAAAIAEAGYDGCSVASNHLLDNGLNGVTATLSHLKKSGVSVSGSALNADREAPALFAPSGVQVAHLSYTDTMNGHTMPINPPWLVGNLETEKVITDATNAISKGAEFVVVSLHFGEPAYQTELSTNQKAIADELLQSQVVDLVIGHGAHVIQTVSHQNEKFAILGLGNFLSNQPGDNRRRCNECPPSTQDGIMVWFEVAERPDGSFTVIDSGYVPTWVDRNTYEIIPLGINEPESVDPLVLLKSADRTKTVVEPTLRRITFNNQ